MAQGDMAPLPDVERTRKYSPAQLETYNQERHILIERAKDIVNGDSSLPLAKLEEAVSSGDIRVYDFEDGRYLDRLDIGRIYHNIRQRKGVCIERYFSRKGEDPFAPAGKLEQMHLKIIDKNKEVIFEMPDAMFPESWEENDARIVAQRYFFKPEKEEWRAKLKKKLGTPYENSPNQLFNRVSRFFGEEGWKLGYFASEEDKEAFIDELNTLQSTRKFSFNSPVYFNAGLFSEYEIPGSPAVNFWRNPETAEVIKIKDGCNIKPQGHACFIRGPTDHLPRILEQLVDEGNIFSSGSGVGSDIGVLREEGAVLSSGGKASGPLSFMVSYDDGAGTIKAGGKSRRAARMQTMRYHHPDIEKFIFAKVNEDRKALALMKAGYSPGMDGEAYGTVTFQNTNFSVRLDAHFFEQLKKEGNIELLSVCTGEVIREVPAKKILENISFGSWRVGDPGVQYESKIQEYNTCPNSGRNNSTNPCGEYIDHDDSSCNLASTNLVAFTDEKGNFDVQSYKRAVRLITIAQDIENDACSYPVMDVARISPEFRTIGQGFANLGTFLMRKGIPYNSEEGRAWAAAISAIMTGTAYETSAELAEHLGTFTHFELNKNPMLNVLRKHKKNLEGIIWKSLPGEMKETAHSSWEKAVEKGEQVGYRNAQVSVIAPTGTTSYLMGCETTGIEPPASLSIIKNLAGGGNLLLASREAENALNNMGFSKEQKKDILEYIVKYNKVVGAPYINQEQARVFETAMGNTNGEGAIPFEGHVKMVAACQPFITGGISKTINLPERATVKDVFDGFILGYELGLKGFTVFRENSKPVAALGFGDKSYVELKRGEKEELPNRRHGFEVEFQLADSRGSAIPFHILVSEYSDGRPGQITFLSYKAGSTLQALLSTHGIAASKALKRGVSLEDITAAWLGQKFEPSGMVYGHPSIKTSLSPLDLAAKVLRLEYLGDFSVVDDKDGLKIDKLRGFENGAFEAYAKMKIDEWDIKQVLENPLLGGFKNSNNKKNAPITISEKKDNEEDKLKNERGVVCSCGFIMRRTAPNCYECTNCSAKIGGCGS